MWDKEEEPIGIRALSIQRKFDLPMSNGQFNRLMAAIDVDGGYDRVKNLTYEEFCKEFGPIEDR